MHAFGLKQVSGYVMSLMSQTSNTSANKKHQNFRVDVEERLGGLCLLCIKFCTVPPYAYDLASTTQHKTQCFGSRFLACISPVSLDHVTATLNNRENKRRKVTGLVSDSDRHEEKRVV